VRYEHHVHINSKAILVTRQWRLVLPVRYEHHLHINSKAIPETGSGDVYFM
jgi:hypothetical protein